MNTSKMRVLLNNFTLKIYLRIKNNTKILILNAMFLARCLGSVIKKAVRCRRPSLEVLPRRKEFFVTMANQIYIQQLIIQIFIAIAMAVLIARKPM